MSFSNDLKNEASKIKIQSPRLYLDELSGFMRTCSVLIDDENNTSLKFVTENASIARRIFTLLKSYTTELEAFSSKNNTFKKTNLYTIVVKDKYAIDDIVYDTEFIFNRDYDNPNYNNPSFIDRNEQSIRAYLRASFLGSGSVTNPERGYHLEFVGRNEEFAEGIKTLLNKKGLNGKISIRKSNFIIYLKEADQISDFMALIGASRSLLKFENVRVVKDLRNNVNRLVNCETANIGKTITASMKQVEDIEYLIDTDRFMELSEDLIEVGKLRLENEESSLKEISELTEGKYSRSGINYRLKKISSLAEKFRGVDYERNES